METPTPPELGTPLPPTAPAEYRFPDDPALSPALRGRTLADASDYIAALERAVSGNGGSAPAAPAPPSNGHGTYATQSQVERLAEQQARLHYDLVRQRHGDVLRRWGSEVAELLSRVPADQRSVEAIENAVTFVKGRHVEEIAAERARAADMTAGFAMRSTGRAGVGSYAPPPPERVAEQAREEWRAHAAAAGIGDRELGEFCAQNDMTADEFFRQFGSGLVTDSIADVSFGRKLKG